MNWNYSRTAFLIPQNSEQVKSTGDYNQTGFPKRTTSNSKVLNKCMNL